MALKALVRDDNGRVLVVREGGRPAWSLPGGGWQHTEGERECLQREVAEETGYEGELSIAEAPAGIRRVYLERSRTWLVWLVYDVECVDALELTGGADLRFADPMEFARSEHFEERFVYELGTT